MKVTVYGQINDGPLYPIGFAEGDTPAEVQSQTAALLRYWASDHDPEASFIEMVMRYDEDDGK